jgi:bifunctional UDP-N-acetylglucosamine pyrophosphorylase/glucosamine-1-phosphate N-acetyltransferase
VQALLAPRHVRFARQQEQKGTGHALKCAQEEIAAKDGLLMVLYGDTPLLTARTLLRLRDTQASSNAAATLITTTLDDPTGYGRVIVDSTGAVTSIVEHKDATPHQRAIRVINSGIYCFRADFLWKYISEIGTDNPAREYYLTDIVEILNRAGYTVASLDIPDSQELLGINTRAELAVVDKIFRDRKVLELMSDGVTIEKPETVTVDCPVRIGADSIVGPFAQILGRTEIGENCRIDACSIIENSKLADRVHVAPFSSIADSEVEAEAKIGPFARLRDRIASGRAQRQFR